MDDVYSACSPPHRKALSVEHSGGTNGRDSHLLTALDIALRGYTLPNMNEVPKENPPLSDEERAVVEQLTPSDLQTIDQTILSIVPARLRKVAWIVVKTRDALLDRYPELSHSFYAQRIITLVASGRLESKGNVNYMRFSEVKLPD
jgi:hypothetical protein